jgi:hypothetical protein
MIWVLVICCIIAFISGFLPSREQIAHRNRVKMAKDEFYLREAEKARSSAQ